MKTEIKLTENGISFQIPFVNKQAGSDFDLDKARMRNKAMPMICLVLSLLVL